jgi:acetyltransferase-like isoleucine patch superfamily enzyme
MAYLTKFQLNELGFKSLGENVSISDKASIYNCDQIEIGDNSRIDDFCVISGNIVIGRFVHITPMCLIAGGEKGVFIEDFSTCAYGVKVFTKSDDYTGQYMTNSCVPEHLKKVYESEVYVKKHSIIGANSVIFPGVTLNEGSSIGAMSLVLEDVEAWSINVGLPSKKIKNRSKNILKLAEFFKKTDEHN